MVRVVNLRRRDIAFRISGNSTGEDGRACS